MVILHSLILYFCHPLLRTVKAWHRKLSHISIYSVTARYVSFIVTYVPFTLSDWLVHTSVLINRYNWPHGVAFLFCVTLSALGGKSNGHVQR